MKVEEYPCGVIATLSEFSWAITFERPLGIFLSGELHGKAKTKEECEKQCYSALCFVFSDIKAGAQKLADDFYAKSTTSTKW